MTSLCMFSQSIKYLHYFQLTFHHNFQSEIYPDRLPDVLQPHFTIIVTKMYTTVSILLIAIFNLIESMDN